MENIPSWILKIISEKKMQCCQCKFLFDNAKYIKAMGIRESITRQEKEAVFIELICPKCKETTMFELSESSLFELAVDILDALETQAEETAMLEEQLSGGNHKKPIKRVAPQRQQSRRSKITRQEINEHVAFLQSNKYHDTFLMEMGMSIEEIEFYKYKKNKNE